MKAIWITGIALISMPVTAFAADLGGKPAYRPGPGSLKDAPVVTYEAPAYNWSGLYGGGFVGAALTNDSSDFAGGFWAGYNWQLSRNFVYGIEADIGLTNATQRDRVFGAVDVDSKIDLFGSVRGRAGYAVDRTLFYATAGLAWANIEQRAGPLLLSESETAVGYVVGGGIEYAFDNSWIARAEYLYSNYGDSNVVNRAGNRAEFDNEMSLLRVGVSHKF